MPIMPFLNGRQFDPEALRILGLAFDKVCIALQVETSGGHSPAAAGSLRPSTVPISGTPVDHVPVGSRCRER